MPVVLPHLPPKFLVSGLGRNESGTGNGSGTVGFSLSLDLAADLRSGNTAPVLHYTTSDTSPPPLRVAISSFYQSERGVWVPRRAGLPALSKNPAVPEATGLSAEVPKKRFTMAFAGNLLDEPNLAAPYPLIAADLDGTEWGFDNQTQDVKVAQRPDSYSVSYWRLEPTATMLQSASTNGSYEGGPFGSDLILDNQSFRTITALSARLTNGKASAYDKAMAIQQYLRATGGFTYSLTLAPPAKDRSGNDAGFDPLTNFLVTKQGYCVQFATAMVMMSRAAGIPARMAIGFLPGTRAKGVWTVTAADAHAWPELYLDGIGWTRFEPTPSRGTPPAYAIPPTSAGTPVGGRPVGETATPAPRSAASKNLNDPTANNGLSTGVGLSPTSATPVADPRLGPGPARVRDRPARIPGRAHGRALASSTRPHRSAHIRTAGRGALGAPDVIAGRSRDRARTKPHPAPAARLLRPRGVPRGCGLRGTWQGRTDPRTLALCGAGFGPGRPRRGRPAGAQGRSRKPAPQGPDPGNLVAQRRPRPAPHSQGRPRLARPYFPARCERRCTPMVPASWLNCAGASRDGQRSRTVPETVRCRDHVGLGEPGYRRMASWLCRVSLRTNSAGQRCRPTKV